MINNKKISCQISNLYLFSRIIVECHIFDIYNRWSYTIYSGVQIVGSIRKQRNALALCVDFSTRWKILFTYGGFYFVTLSLQGCVLWLQPYRCLIRRDVTLGIVTVAKKLARALECYSKVPCLILK